ncbi:MAG: PA14 domain-containing protein, partial [Pirellulaceae bacterium]
MSFEPAAVIFRTRLRMLVLVGLASASVAISGRADPHPRIAGFERFYAVDVESPAMGGGWLLLTELNCLSCHKAGPLTGLPGPKPAPRLDRVGARVRPDFVRSMLLAPQHAKPGTTMPWLPLDDQVPGLERLTRPERVEALVHYLASLGELTESAPMSAAVRQGEELYHAVGCVACHDVQRESTPPLANSVPLPDLVAKYTLPGLAQFLEDPLAVRPGGRMPHLNLTGDEARQIASFLLRRLDIPANLTYRYYEGGWEKLPNFDRLAPKEVGRTSGFDVRIAAQDHFAVQFEGQMQLQREGTYRFFLHSDDGSRLYLDGELVVDNDGVHAGQEVSARRDLAAGRHAVRVEYFEQAGGEELRIEFQGPGVKRQSLELAMVAATSVPVRDAFRVDPELVRHGRELYHAVGCASCHGVPDATPATTELPRGKPLARLAEQGGCLAAEPSSGAPRFGLNARQRDQLAAVLAAWKKGARGIAADQQIRHTMQTFNCVACHARDDWGGVETARNTFFRSNQPEMGDEGRIPPHLTRVGDKLQT